MTTEFPLLPSGIGRRGKLRDPDGTVHFFTVIDEVTKTQTRYADGGTAPRKILVLQRLRFDTGVTELRLGYYIIGKRPAMLGKWVWGQYATLVPEEDFIVLVDHARARGWFVMKNR